MGENHKNKFTLSYNTASLGLKVPGLNSGLKGILFRFFCCGVFFFGQKE
jgi:hypothetical protein